MVSNAQSFKEMKQAAKAEMKEKASKDARKAAKKDAKDGWKAAPGTLPLEKQYERSFTRQAMEDPETGELMFIWGDATSPGQTYDAAKRQAMELAKNLIANQIESNMTEMVKNSVSNDQLTADEAASITKTVTESRSIISQKLTNVRPFIEVYRDLPNKTKEVRVMVFYNSKQVQESAKAAVRDQLKKDNEELGKKLDEKLGW